jgi:uncharacterized membrane protein
VAELIVLGFKETTKADEVVPLLPVLRGEGLLQLEDWARVIRREDGNIDVRQGTNTTGAGAAGGAVFGGLIGLLFLMPLVGAAVGAAAGAVIGHFTDYGISDQFINDVGKEITPGSSALFLYVIQATMDRVVDRLQPYGPTVLRTSLSHDAEDRLRAAMQEQAPESGGGAQA